MSATASEPPLVPLGLPWREQWVLHHVLSKRLEPSRRRRPTGMPPAPAEVRRSLRKVEAGSLLFTVPELLRTREVLSAYLRTEDAPAGERRDVGRIVGRIDDALARRRSPRGRFQGEAPG